MATHPKKKQGSYRQIQRVTRTDLHGLDALAHEALGLFCWADIRPLGGVAGYLDWRLCGALSRVLEKGTFSGAMHESLLFRAPSRLGDKRLFVFGLGPFAGGNAAVEAVVTQAYTSMRAAGVDNVVLAAPKSTRHPEAEAAFVEAADRALPGPVALILVEAS